MHRQIKNVLKPSKHKKTNVFVRRRTAWWTCWHGYGAMVAEDIQIGLIANRREQITLTHTKGFSLPGNIVKEIVASTNVKNVQTLVKAAETLSSTPTNGQNHEADMLGFKTVRYNDFKLYKLTNGT